MFHLTKDSCYSRFHKKTLVFGIPVNILLTNVCVLVNHYTETTVTVALIDLGVFVIKDLHASRQRYIAYCLNKSIQVRWFVHPMVTII